MYTGTKVRNRFVGPTCSNGETVSDKAPRPEHSQNGGTRFSESGTISDETDTQKRTLRRTLSDQSQNGGTMCSESGTSSDETDTQKRTLRRTLSDRIAYGEKPTVIKRTESETHSTLAGILAGTRHIVEEAEEFVKNVINVGWRVVHHHTLPDWLKDNEHLVFGHRVQLHSFSACFKSVFKIHTETGNIWTHLLGMLLFICIATYTLCSRYWDWMWQDITVHSIFFAGAILCLTFSWLFHTVFCHSESVNRLFSKLDYCGIALLTVAIFVPWLYYGFYCHKAAHNIYLISICVLGTARIVISLLDYCGIALLTVASFVPWLYYGFYCHKAAHIIYLISICVLGTACIVISLFDKFAAPAYRPVRAGLFIALGLTGVIPGLHFVLIEGLFIALGLTGVIPGFHFVLIEGIDVAVYEYGFMYLITMATLYIAGALMYAFRIPESLYPGYFDIWFHSHQIFHVCVILAALAHFHGINIISHVRLNISECP